MTRQDELSRLREEAARILKDVRASTHPQDIRDAGQALNGKWDQDFPTALLKLVVDDGNTITALRTALSRAEDSLTRAHVENAELREALGPFARQAVMCRHEHPETIIGLLGDNESVLRRKDADRAARVLSSTSPSPILAEIARLREALSGLLVSRGVPKRDEYLNDISFSLAKAKHEQARMLLAALASTSSTTTLDK